MSKTVTRWIFRADLTQEYGRTAGVTRIPTPTTTADTFFGVKNVTKDTSQDAAVTMYQAEVRHDMMVHD